MRGRALCAVKGGRRGPLSDPRSSGKVNVQNVSHPVGRPRRLTRVTRWCPATPGPTFGDPLYQMVFGEDITVYDIGFFFPGKPGIGIGLPPALYFWTG